MSAGTDYILVTLTGECDLTTGRDLRDVLTSAVSCRTQRLIVDVSRLAFMDSTGMQVLLGVRSVLAVRGGTLALVSPQPVVARVLQVTGADQMIPVYGSLEEAEIAG